MTICSYDNSGQIKFDVDVEMEQGYWNTSSSNLWTKIRDWMHEDLVAIYKDLRQNGLSYETLMSYFYDQQIAVIPQTYYNNDCDVKYIPYANEYIGKAHGDGYEHLKRWLKRRITFCDTLFDYAPSYTNDVLTIRANTTETMTLEIETYTPVYQHLSWYNNQMDKKKIDGKTSVTFTGKAQAATDQEVLIYGGSNIKSIKGISTMNPNQMLIGSATRLIELEASNCPLLVDINSNKANLSPHTYLNKVDLSGCSQLGGALRLNNSPLIRDVNMKGTVITSIQMPTSVRNLEVLRLPNTIPSLTLQDASLLNTLELDEGSSLQSISLTNCNNLTNAINFDLTQTPTVYLDNSYNAQELYMSATTNLTLRNMSTLERVIYTPNSEYETFDINNVINGSTYKITTFNNPLMKEFITTAPHRLSYQNGDYGDIKPFTSFTANTLDLSDTQFTDVKFLCTTDLYNLKVPTSMKNFYCDSAFDIDTDVIEDASYEVIHDELIEAYTTNYESEVLLNDATPNIIPSSASGSLIFNLYSNNTTQPTSTSPYMWDLTGLKLNDFYTYGMNNWVKQDAEGNITMPQRLSGYSVRMVNADITPNNYATHLYPLLVDTTLPITGKLDYRTYNGSSLAWAYAYTTDDVTRLPLDSRNQSNITNDYNKLYGTDYVDIIDVWAYKNDDFSNRSTNELITDVYIELSSDNYKSRVFEVLQWYPNCTNLYLFDDKTVTTLSSFMNMSDNAANNPDNYNKINDGIKNVKNVYFMEGYFENLTSLDNSFRSASNILTINNIPKSITDFYSAFIFCINLNQEFDLSEYTIQKDKLQYTWYSCYALTYTPILPSDYTGSLAQAFVYDKLLSEAPSIPDGVTSLASTFQGCEMITTINSIPSTCDAYSNTFNGCKSLISVPVDGWNGNMASTFYNCSSLNQQINISFSTNLNNTFYGCSLLSITPNLPSNYNGAMQSTFYGCSSLITPPITPSEVSDMSSCYRGCSKMTTAPNIPSKCNVLTNCFYGCNSLINGAILHENITDISYLYYNCNSLKTAQIPVKANYGSYSPLQGCVSLEEITWIGYMNSDYNLPKLADSLGGISSIITQKMVQDLVPEHLDDGYKDNIKISMNNKTITVNDTNTTWE